MMAIFLLKIFFSQRFFTINGQKTPVRQKYSIYNVSKGVYWRLFHKLAPVLRGERFFYQ
jgi:hypothetical protein